MELSRTIGVIEAGIDRGLHPGAQLYVSRHGRTIFDDAFGRTAFNGGGAPVRADSLTLWMSAGKPVAAVALAQLVAVGRVTLDDLVCQHVPAFDRHGKRPITVRHLLQHTAGFRGPMGSFEPGSWEHQVEKACNLKLEPGWIPGAKAGYHPGSSWFILGEIVRTASGQPYDRYVRDHVFGPLGEADVWVGLPHAQWNAFGDRIAPTLITDPQQRNVVTRLNDPEINAIPRPGANARGPIRALGRLYEALLAAEWPRRDSASPKPPPLGLPGLPGEESITRRSRVGLFDHTFKCVLDWGLGVLVDSKEYAGPHPYGYGRYASPDTFGHSGNQCACAFADPAHGLVVAWVCTGMPGEAAHDARQRAVNEAVYEDLGLAF